MVLEKQNQLENQIGLSNHIYLAFNERNYNWCLSRPVVLNGGKGGVIFKGVANPCKKARIL